ncbi:MAG TPA: chemotaxis protein CheW [Terriglobia bacterium]|nr:chemotaxis protein CheW [Terriglobia bacterium]
MNNATEATGQSQFLTFLLADDLYAVSILRIREIIEYDTVTRVPNMPESIRGVINLRGAVVPVVDLAMRFGLRDSNVTKRTCVIIAEVEVGGERLVMGLMADSVNQVIDLPPADIEPPPAFGTRVRVDFLKGLGKLGKKFVLILDLDRALSDTELFTAAASESAPKTPSPKEQAIPAAR